jgi:large subunit ribosomal protein L4
MSVATFTKTGTKATSPAKLDKAIFGVDVPNHELLKQAYVGYLANGRIGSAQTKKRGDVRGGGKKPWRQKGTGRARFGSSRNPIWRGGGIVFGPTGDENYKQSLTTRSKRTALKQALSLAADAKKLHVIESLEFTDGKTSTAVKIIQKMGLTGNILLVTTEKPESLVRATRNISYVQVVNAKYLTVFNTLNADQIVVTQGSLKIISDWLGASVAPAPTEGK